MVSFMDVCIDTEYIEDGIENISDIIENLDLIIQIMIEKLNIAGKDFTSINYERASIKIKLAIRSLRHMNCKLDDVKVYLKDLIYLINRYNNLKFR